MRTEVTIDLRSGLELVLGRGQYCESVNNLLAVSWKRGCQVVVPLSFRLHVINALHEGRRRRRLKEGWVQTALERLKKILPMLKCVNDSEDFARATAIARRYACSLQYQALYAAVAERLKSELWTGDRSFYDATRTRLRYLRWIGDCRPE